ncbi:hypothetical protein AAFN60_12140 [Roseibacillus persicicus]|uniref:DUF4871 domain-containing protein n=1 Tax=Roseibacillus persicicus TaxID=454148 RepID=A0A918TQW7_9BACT|nr:hypothetical protein [Roseibacillus persicicus]GHC59303.1 hypothetical protein GCM10007100_28040 [Roseibacillus persicicus]
MKAVATFSLWFLLVAVGFAQDPGKETVARLRTVLLFGTNDNLAEVVPDVPVADKGHAGRMELLKNLHFKNYGLLGSEVKPIWRSYTNWSSPMKGSDEILLSFEPNSQAEADGVKLDLELWQGKRKVMKTTHPLKNGKWLYIAGPDWRGGRLILGIELLPLSEK